MRDNHLTNLAAPSSVDWPARQTLFFRALTLPFSRIAARLGKSPDQVERWGNCAAPVPLHEAFRLAEAVGDTRLIGAYARDVEKLIIDRPRPDQEGAVNMEVCLDLQTDAARLSQLVYKRTFHPPLTREEDEEYDVLCDRVVQSGVLLQRFKDVAKAAK